MSDKSNPTQTTRQELAKTAQRHYDNSKFWKRVAERTRELLLDLEWAGTFPKPHCPMCNNFQTAGHADDCKVGRELKMVIIDEDPPLGWTP